MMSQTALTTRVTAGADTHRDQHVVAALDERGAELGVRSFPTTPAGYGQALAWLRGFGPVEKVLVPRDLTTDRRGGAPERACDLAYRVALCGAAGDLFTIVRRQCSRAT